MDDNFHTPPNSVPPSSIIPRKDIFSRPLSKNPEDSKTRRERASAHPRFFSNTVDVYRVSRNDEGRPQLPPGNIDDESHAQIFDEDAVNLEFTQMRNGGNEVKLYSFLCDMFFMKQIRSSTDMPVELPYLHACFIVYYCRIFDF